MVKVSTQIQKKELYLMEIGEMVLGMGMVSLNTEMARSMMALGKEA